MNCAWPRAMWLVTSDPIVFRSPSFKVVLVALIAINAEKIRNTEILTAILCSALLKILYAYIHVLYQPVVYK